MLYAVIKALISGVIIAAASEAAKRSPAIGAIILSLPLTSILAFIWLWRDTSDTERISALAQSTFWFVLPSLPLFLVLPVLLRSGAGFWASLGLSCLVTVLLYAAHGVGARQARRHALNAAASWGTKPHRRRVYPLVTFGGSHNARQDAILHGLVSPERQEHVWRRLQSGHAERPDAVLRR